LRYAAWRKHGVKGRVRPLAALPAGWLIAYNGYFAENGWEDHPKDAAGPSPSPAAAPAAPAPAPAAAASAAAGPAAAAAPATAPAPPKERAFLPAAGAARARPGGRGRAWRAGGVPHWSGARPAGATRE
jgi:hypothetical protein